MSKAGVARPLDGVLALDLCRSVAGAYATMLLADMGARVIKIEPPGAGRWAPEAATFDCGKQSVYLDLTDPRSRPAFEALVRRADVLVEGFGPGEARRLGIETGTLAAVNPRLVHCALPPFGSSGPLADRPADDWTVDAFAGVHGEQGGWGVPMSYGHLPLAAYGSAFLAALGVTAALRVRDRTGRGQRVEVPLIAGGLAVQSAATVRGKGLPSAAVSPLLNNQALGRQPAYRLFECRDGEWLFVACGNVTFWNKFCIAMGVPEVAADPRYEGAPWATPLEAQDELHVLFEGLFRTRPRGEWLRVLEDADVPHGAVQTREEFVHDPQVRHNRILVDLQDPVVGGTRQVGVAVCLSDTPGGVASPAPVPGEHTDAVLREVLAAEAPTRGRAREESTGALRTPADGAALPAPYAGVRVLDLASYIAGGFASTFLADLGATVVKVEGPGGDGFRVLAPGFCSWNRGKRGILLDLQRTEGRAALHRMVAQADVLIQNYRVGSVARLGANYETLSRINPRLVYCSITGHGPDGPLRDIPAFDPVFQARSGAMAAQGGSTRTPVFLRVAISDYATAMLSAWAVALGLHARERTGRGQRIEVCLLDGCFAVQAGEFLSYPGKPPPEYLDQLGPRADRRMYATGDGWLFVSCSTDSQRSGFLDVLGLPPRTGGGQLPDSAVPLMASRFMTGATAAWLERLEARGVPCAPVRRVVDLHDDPQLNAMGLWVEHDSAEYGRLRELGVPVLFSLTPGAAQRAAPALGEHTEEVLAEFGFTPSEVEKLRRAGALGPA